jgi:hypothetical protein
MGRRGLSRADVPPAGSAPRGDRDNEVDRRNVVDYRSENAG